VGLLLSHHTKSDWQQINQDLAKSRANFKLQAAAAAASKAVMKPFIQTLN